MQSVGAGDLGAWAPLALSETRDLFDSYEGRWWIAGGLALELFVGDSWRDHDDTDVGILRQDAGVAWPVLEAWDPHVAAAGNLSRWDGSDLLVERQQNNVWCRRNEGGPWCLDLTIGDGDATCLVYRRDPSVRVEWSNALLQSSEGIPYLAPELQMLYKSSEVRPKDDVDAGHVLPGLGKERRAWLAGHLPVRHPWQTLLE
jgi:hypothetical protein